MALIYDSGTWDRLEVLLARATALTGPKRAELLDEIAVEEPHLAEELASLLALTSPSSRFFRKLERTLYEHGDREDTGAVLARYDPLIGSTLAGRYALESVRGRGGMGTVYRARDGSLDLTVAVKVLSRRLSADPAGRKRFLREARTMAKLRHPNVCPVIDAGESEDGLPFLVMPYLEGTTLSKRLRAGPLPLEEAVDWLRQTCDGLGAIHRARLVHRDLSPSNLIRTSEGTIRILDFGLSRIANATLSTKSRALGTLPYMAPEQLTDEKVDFRADIWSLGAIFYEMVAGERPFTGASIPEIHTAILEVEPRPLIDVAPTVSLPLSDAIARALAKSPKDRLASTHDLIRSTA